ncbi:hypothetical protein PDIG_62120 [Penicillium digitatum PHI26]|uniref:Alpha-ketoglutarate-dependent sulfonate dioxygenase n=2 Tax=Penicillium digitatum TaxID=36651 RepID=K9G8A8_PEND2|nr:hypothetical protein PDIP_71510 [Penicillium digitatum Pd1]EKV07871.1 hypothetical protein PDIP_71510 [Penicillium digitatum Pd1]EKV09441.1 hypothetical protein PDIG_62120 [Penicillium digitatum PHI26]
MGGSTDEISKEVFNQSETIGKSSDERPPSYSANQAEQPALQLPQLDLSSHPSSNTITRDQCVVHLKFLAVLADLRDTISSDDGLFGIYDAKAEIFPKELNEARARIREKRWAVYTARAVERYTKWWSTGLPRSRPMATINDLESVDYENILSCNTRVAWSTDNLPPLDILMVWHAHSLNPRNYLEDCIRYGRISTWATGFPWEAIDRCISNHTMEYTVSEQVQRLFEQKLNLKWNNLHDPLTKHVKCPCCGWANAVPWTKARFGGTVANAFKFSSGYADFSFEVKCFSCKHTIDHGRLKVAKFRKDLKAAIEQDLPMPGSFTSLYGIPEGGSIAKKNHQPLRDMLFPTRVVQASRKGLLHLTNGRLDLCQNVTKLKEQLETKLRDTNLLWKAHGVYLKSLQPAEKIQFRRMMSRYWDNLGPFALDLVGAVIRQGTFVDKMDQIDWLHSPTVFNTMDRLTKKYEVFFQIMIENPEKMAVPTLDVDLAWHTHQLSPSRYYNYSTSQVKPGGKRMFIDHDDKVDEEKLSDGFAWTSKMYRRVTNGGIYSECTCWYCEATRTPDLYSRLITVGSASRARTAADLLHDRPDISSDPNKNPHISSHNAVRPTNQHHRPDWRKSLQRARLQSNYQKAARRAEKRRQRSGSQSSSSQGDAYPYYMPYAYGYPIVVPYYGPYMMDPSINCDSYACNPGCMNVTAGATGNCCAGTCGKLFLHPYRSIE